MPARPHRTVDRVIEILETVSSPNHTMRRRQPETPRGKRILKARLDSARRLAAGDACVAFGIDAEVLPHYENWGEFPVMVSVRSTGLRSESATNAAADLLDLDDVAACSHLTTAIIALPVRARHQVPRGDDWRAATQRPSK